MGLRLQCASTETGKVYNILCFASARRSKTTLLTAALPIHTMMQLTRYLSQLAAQGLMVCCEGATFTRMYVKGLLIEVRIANNI